MARCDAMQGSYTMTGSGIYNGVVTTTSAVTAPFYHYGARTTDWHFTLGNTGRGATAQRSMANMHFTVELSVNGGVANGHIFFDSTGLITGNNDAELSQAARAAFQTYRTAHATDIQAVITCMAGQLV